VALAELQVSVGTPPPASTVGYTANVAVGSGDTGVTPTVAVATELLPPAPEQVIEKVEFAVSAPVLRLPLPARAPLQAPEAVHAVASVELQVKVAELPLPMVVGFAVNVAVGKAGGAVVAGEWAVPPPQATNSSIAPAVPRAEAKTNNRMTSPVFFIVSHWMRTRSIDSLPRFVMLNGVAGLRPTNPLARSQQREPRALRIGTLHYPAVAPHLPPKQFGELGARRLSVLEKGI